MVRQRLVDNSDNLVFPYTRNAFEHHLHINIMLKAVIGK